MLRVREANTTEQFNSLGKCWDSLLSRSSNDTVFLTWEWLYTWWEAYCPKKRLHILLVYENDESVIAIAPFYATHEKTMGIPVRVLRLIGSEEVCSEYLDIICEKERTAEVIKALADYLSHEGFVKCDIIHLNDVLEGSIIDEVLKQLSLRNNAIYHETVQTTNPFITLPEKEDVFMSAMSSNRRSALKRNENRLKKEHGFTYGTVNEKGLLKEAFYEFVDLHQRHWEDKGLPGMFKRKNFLGFHQAIAERFAENGWLRLYFLYVNEKPVASLYGFQYSDKFYYYQAGLDPAWKTYGAGKILLKHTICEAIRDKLKEYDFLRGDADYKFHFTDKFRNTKEVVLAGDSSKAKLFLLHREMRKRTKNVFKQLFPESLITRVRRIRDNIMLR